MKNISKYQAAYVYYWYKKAVIWYIDGREWLEMALEILRFEEWCRCTKVPKDINWYSGVSETRSERCDRKICQCDIENQFRVQKLLYLLSPNFGKLDIAQPDHSPRTETLSKTFRRSKRKLDFPCIEGKRPRNLIREKRVVNAAQSHSRRWFRCKLLPRISSRK